LKDNSERSAEILDWIGEDVLELSKSQYACRVVQNLLDVPGRSRRDSLVAALSQHTVQLYESPHGNYVLTKAIEVMPSASLGPIIQQIAKKGHLQVARHRFGCRILERLIEHCTEKEMGSLIDKFIADAPDLCRHQYGNFVIQHLLEHGSERRRSEVMEKLLDFAPQLAGHRTASHVVQRMLNYVSLDERQAIAHTLFAAPAPYTFEEMAAGRYGSYVAEELISLRMPWVTEEVKRRLELAPEELQKTPFFARVAVQCKLPPHPESQINSKVQGSGKKKGEAVAKEE